MSIHEQEIKSFLLALRAENKAAKTIKLYEDSVRQFATFLHTLDPDIDLAGIRRAHIQEWIVSLQELGRAPATISARFRALQQFFKWALDEEEITKSPMEKLSRPIVPDKSIAVIEPDQIELLLKTVNGSDFYSRRDRALISLLYDTGIRAAECMGLHTDDLDLTEGLVVISNESAKGRVGRVVPIGPKTVRDLDRYLRARTKHPLADTPWVWLGGRGRQLAKTGLQQMLDKRGKQAGIGHLHPHQFRHTFAHEFLAGGGNEGDLMRLTGWKSRDMLERYGASNATRRAQDSHRKLSPRDRVG